MMYEDLFRAHLAAVDLIASAGIPAPEPWTALRQRHIDYLALESPVRQQLIAAIVEPTDADLNVLNALALAEIANPKSLAAIHTSVSAAVRHRHVAQYSKVAAANYLTLAARFDGIAEKFTAAVAVVNPESDPAGMVTADAKSRTAWSEAALLGNDLDSLIPALLAAATLAGTTVHPRDGLLPLTVDPTGLHVRRVWESWVKQDGRTGRWGALAAMGARLRACRLDEFQPYPEPKPLEHRTEQIARGQTRVVTYDPHDADYRVAPIEPTRGAHAAHMMVI